MLDSTPEQKRLIGLALHARKLSDQAVGTAFCRCPIVMGAQELENKAANEAEDLRRSSKLFRAIEAFQCAARAPGYAPVAKDLMILIDQLRSMSGWSELDTWLPADGRVPPSKPKGRARK